MHVLGNVEDEGTFNILPSTKENSTTNSLSTLTSILPSFYICMIFPYQLTVSDWKGQENGYEREEWLTYNDIHVISHPFTIVLYLNH